MFARVATAALLALGMTWGMAWAGAGPAAAEDDPVVAIVNGHEIHLSMVRMAHQNLPPQYQQVPFDAIFSGLVESLIDTRLAAADARRQKVHEEQAFKDRMARIEEQVLQRMVLARAMESGVTDADLRARYDMIAKEMAGNEQIQARHVLLETEAAAKEVIEALKKGGDFSALAKERSTGPSAADGGDLGTFSKGQMVPAFEEAAFALKKGEYSQVPVKTQFGWHVIKVEDRKMADVPTFEEVEQTLRNDLSQEIGAAYIAKLREGAEINRFNADGSPLKEPTAEKPAEKK
ncbi:MAG: peptidylprolyl isomerase [Rhodospirillales bacterium]